MAFFSNKKSDTDIHKLNIPKHIGIIMDGNGRWAKKRHLPRSAGHTQGAKVFRKIARYCSDIGVEYLTVYAFSTENWKRPDEEVNSLMRLFKEYLNEALRDFKDDSIVVRFIGDKAPFSKELQELMIKNEEESKSRDGMVLNIAMNYGSRDELVRAVKNISQNVKDGSIKFSNVSFSYGRDKNAKLCLSDINLDIKSGETVGIIGGNKNIGATFLVAKHIVGTTSYEYARMFGGNFLYSLALNAE